jgi:hypothetical protein
MKDLRPILDEVFAHLPEEERRLNMAFTRFNRLEDRERTINAWFPGASFQTRLI